jgi:hypothetical protein
MDDHMNDEQAAAEAAVLAEAERVIAPRRLVWVPKLADPTRPTTEEIAAGVDLTPEDPAEKMPLGDSGDEHIVGAPKCLACWADYPKACEQEGCTGLVHASFGDENADCEYWLYTKCDVCGEPE